jgi:16S rRNA (guanine1516-N2)-methyltransferase
LALRNCAQPGTHALVIDPQHRRRPAPGRDLIARSLGRGCRSIIDATAGFGTDAFDFARRGKKVTAIERVGVIAAMLEDAAQRFRFECANAQFVVVAGDACEQIVLQQPADVIFLDPMFPQTQRHTALARKSQQLLRVLAGDDRDAQQLVNIARENALRRVVVKRPRHAVPLAANPDSCFKGRSIRYDVYLAGAS